MTTECKNSSDCEMTGSLSILNVGEGDINITFNRENPDETAQAITMLQDMQRRGYAIMIRLPDDTYVRAQSIDAEHGAYVVMLPADAPRLGEEVIEQPVKGKGRGTRKVALPVEKTQAVGIARSAGG
jgi:hypothetical protein